MFRSILAESSRALVAVLSAVPLTVAAVAVNASPAAAAVPDRWGFAFMHNATPPPGLALDATRSWGSWKVLWPADPVRVFPGGVGQYRVRFPCVGVREGHVQVTAFGPSPDHCHLQEAWATLGAEVVVRNVICFNGAGAQAPNRFFVTYSSRV